MDGIAVAKPSGLPRGVLLGAGALMTFTIVTAGTVRLSGQGALRAPGGRAVETLTLKFEDRDDGAVVVRNSGTGNSIFVVAPGTNGFMRATVRGLVRERKRSGIGQETPFLLEHWDDGRLSLEDRTTGRSVALEAFGATNAQAFAQLFGRSGDAK